MPRFVNLSNKILCGKTNTDGVHHKGEGRGGGESVESELMVPGAHIFQQYK